MATYTDQSTFRRDLWPSSTEIEERFVKEAATIATNYIDAKLNTSYTVPFTLPYPAMIISVSNLMTKLIAMSLVMQGTLPRLKDLSGGDLSPVSMLQDIISGKMSLPGLSRLSGPWVSTEGQMHVFDIDDELSHYADSDRLDDLSNDRQSY